MGQGPHAMNIQAAMARAPTQPVGDAMYRLMVESVTDYAIFLLDRDGVIRSWNAGAQRIKGYAADEVIGRHFSIFYDDDLLA